MPFSRRSEGRGISPAGIAGSQHLLVSHPAQLLPTNRAGRETKKQLQASCNGGAEAPPSLVRGEKFGLDPARFSPPARRLRAAALARLFAEDFVQVAHGPVDIKIEGHFQVSLRIDGLQPVIVVAVLPDQALRAGLQSQYLKDDVLL